MTKIHLIAYDALADEYESRAASLAPVTEDAMEFFVPFVRRGGRVLDIGCGVGTVMSVMAKRGFSVTGIDLSSRMAAYARRRNPGAEVVVGDFLTSDFGQKFDAVIAFAYVHLYPSPEVPAVLAKLRSVLKPGGVAHISSTESVEPMEGWVVKGGYGQKVERFRKFWTEAEMRAALEAAGFEIVALNKYPDPYDKVWMDFVVRSE